MRVSLFVDAETAAIEWAAGMGGDRVELYTEPFARASAHGEAGAAGASIILRRGPPRARKGPWRQRRPRSHLENLVSSAAPPHLAEVSIGHAIISRAIYVGLAKTVREYLAVLRGGEA